MARWRGTALVLLLVFVGVPLAMPLVELLTAHHIFAGYRQRLLAYAGNTLLLIAGTLLVALPLGTAAAVLLYRTNLPGRRALRFLTVVTLFVPLPVLTTAWQTALGAAGIWTPTNRVWAEGLGPAIWIHSQAALPWVILIVGQGLLRVEPELEEDALLAAGAWRVMWSVTLPRCRGAIAAAALWVGLQVNGEIAVADMMLVETFARQVYNVFTMGGGDELARAVAMCLPFVVIGTVTVYWCLTRLDGTLPPWAAILSEPRPFPLRGARWPWFGAVLAALSLLAGVPVGSLFWKTGLVGYPLEWDWAAMTGRVESTLRADAMLVEKSLLTMFLSAGLIATVALLLCWLALDAPRFRRVLFALTALAWVMPAPIVGFGLKETIMAQVTWVPFEPLSVALYDGPSPAPVLWAHLLRFLPFAIAAFWPAVRQLPSELRDSLRLDGARPSQELRYLVWPLLRRTWLAVVVIIAAMALGEIGAVAMGVETPDWKMFAHVLFDRMHYGQPHDVTALCLVLLLAVVAGGIAVGLLRLLSLKLSELSLKGSNKIAQGTALGLGRHDVN